MKTGKERDWNKYKIAAKRRKLEESAKSSIDLKSFFSMKSDHHEQSNIKVEEKSLLVIKLCMKELLGRTEKSQGFMMIFPLKSLKMALLKASCRT